jgi:replicative DNA helicase Mcm
MLSISPIEKSFQFGDIFTEFLDCFKKDDVNYYQLQINAIINAMGSHNTHEIYINLDHVNEYDKKLARWIIDNPDEAIEECNERFKNKIRPFTDDDPYHVRFYSDCGLNQKTIRELRKNDIDKLIYISAVVINASPVRSIITEAAFECRVCGTEMLIRQDSEILQYPETCGNQNCKASKKSHFKYRSRDSSKLDIQILKIQEPLTDLTRPGDIPYTINVYLYDTIVDFSRTGQHVKVMGIYRNEPTENAKGAQRTICEPFIYANNIEAEDIEQIDDLSDDDKAKIIEMKNDIVIRQKIINSIASHIKGHENLKLASALCLFGGVEKKLDTGTIRGLIHALFMGDASTGKSQILKAVAELSPRHIYTSGQGSSAAGLTAAVTNDANMGGWTLEAGAIPRASGGVCAIDEFDKMNELDRKAIHEVMEQQTCSVCKAGIVATLPARTTIIAGANPRNGHYDEYKTPIENINLSPTIISRFDIIFIVKDKSDKQKDEEIAEQILSNHMGVKKITEIEKIEKDLLRKYIIYAKRECKPKISPEIAQRIKNFYVKIRSEQNGFMVARNLDGIVRMCEAHAKMGLQDEVTHNDVDAVLELMQKSLKELGYDPDLGIIDMDRIITGVSKKDREESNNIYDSIRNLLIERYQQTNETPYISFDEIFKGCNSITSKEQLKKILNNLQKQHQIKIESNNRISTDEQIWLFPRK